MKKTFEPLRLFQRFSALLTQQPWHTILARGGDKLSVYLQTPLQGWLSKGHSFSLFNRKFPYAIYPYNATWRNERAVEIAIALDFLSEMHGKKILEVGNVTSYYQPIQHIVLDKYEKHPGVLNADFVNYQPAELFDAFLSISTFEHIGWDETPRDPHKVKEALAHLYKLVRSPENVLVTFPLGYQPVLDELAREGKLPFQQSACLIRKSTWRWEEASPTEATQCLYGSRFPGANALYIGKGLRH
jgi:hypothetical protein